MKLQASKASNLKNLQSQNAIQVGNRLWLSVLEVIHGRLSCDPIRALRLYQAEAAPGLHQWGVFRPSGCLSF
jgi:hypothetical protein